MVSFEEGQVLERRGQFPTKCERKCEMDREDNVFCWIKSELTLISASNSPNLTVTTHRTPFSSIAFVTFLWADMVAVCG